MTPQMNKFGAEAGQPLSHDATSTRESPAKRSRVSMAEERTKVGVLGGGAWGTALAIHCARMGHDTIVWSRNNKVVESINSIHENSVYFSGYQCPDNLTATTDKKHVIKETQVLLVVIPTPHVAEVLEDIAKDIRPDHHYIVSCTKGILNETLETVNEIIQRVLPAAFHPRLAYLSGPSFAAEVAKGLPACVTIAAHNEDTAIYVQAVMSTVRFRCYRTTDVAGVEMGGALKNVLAIACGISDGLEFGNSARAALITRGNAEILRLAVAKGAQPLTMAGLSGVGDLVLTCTGNLSRNRTVGLRIGQGETLEAIVQSTKAVAEGVLTSRSANALAQKLDVDCPIINGIFRVLHGGEDPASVVHELMSRGLSHEIHPTLET